MFEHHVRADKIFVANGRAAKEGGIGLGHAGAEAALRLNARAVGDGEMPGEADLAADLAIVADAGAARHAHLGGESSIFPNFCVVGDVDEIVEFGAPTDDGAANGRAVNAGTGADFHVIFEDDVADVRHFFPSPVLLCRKPKAIGTHDGIGMKGAVFPHHAVKMYPNTGKKSAAVADAGVAPDVNLWINRAIVANHRTFFDDRKCPDARADTDFGSFVDGGLF